MSLVSEIRKEISSEIESLKNSLANGAAGSYDGYQRIVGEIAGYEKAIALVVQVFDKHFESEED